MALPTYQTGTASVAAGGTVVTGSGTLWSGINAKQGDFISIGGSDAVLITEVTDATHLKVSPWPDAAKTNQAYILYQSYVGRVVGVAAAEDVGVMLEKLHTDGLPFIVGASETVPDPSYGDDGQMAFKPSTGQWWTKAGGAWVPSAGMNAAGYGGTSTSSVTIGTGAKVFSTQTGLAYNGARVRAASSASPANWLEGIATYSGTTLSITSDATGGSGTFASWVFAIAGTPGAGAGDVVGPASAVADRIAVFNGTTGKLIKDGGQLVSGLAPLASPAFSGNPTAPTPTAGDNDTSIATTQFVTAAVPIAATATPLIENGGGAVGTATKWAREDHVHPAAAGGSGGKRNRIVNGAMMISQENGATASGGSVYYPVDQFVITWANAGTISTAQVASATPGGSPNRLRVTVTAADASVAAADYNNIAQRIEGLRCADLRFGSAAAKTITIRFGVKAPAGTYGLALYNSAGTRSYLAEYTIAGGEANTDVAKSVTIPGDTSGTWLADSGNGMTVIWTLMAGTSYQGAANTWTTGVLATASQFNIMGTNGNVFELFDVGLYEGATAPGYELPDFATELALCKRYWQSSYDIGVVPGTAWTGGSDQYKFSHPSATFSSAWSILPMRADPTATFYDHAGTAGKVSYYNGTAFVAGGTIGSSVAKQNFLFAQHTIASSTFTNFSWKADARL